MASVAETTNVFEGGSAFGFEAYSACRPDYTLSNVYDILWEYHTAHDGQWGLAHDVGCGPGQVAEVLSSRSQKVVASDAAPFNVNLARTRLRPNEVEVVAAKAEELCYSEPADMNTAAECMPLSDQPKAVKNFSKLLRPGGTLATWVYGGPIFPNEERDIQSLFGKIDSKSYDMLRPFKRTSWQRNWEVMASWFDMIGLPESDWKDIRRIKWNNGIVPMTFKDLEELDFEIEGQSEVGKDDKFEEIGDRSFWSKKVDFGWAGGFIDAQIPRPKDYKTVEILEMYRVLKEMMGTEKHDITWPVVLVLATKK